MWVSTISTTTTTTMANCRLCFELYSTRAIPGSRDSGREPLRLNLFTRQIVLPANEMATKRVGIIRSEPFDPATEWDPADLFRGKIIRIGF